MDEKSEAKDLAKELINKMVSRASSEEKQLESKSFDCLKCKGKFLIRVYAEAKLIFEVCGIELKNYHDKSLHIEEKHDMSGTVKCPQCSTKLKSNEEVTNHVKQYHIDSIIKIIAQIVINSVSEKFKKCRRMIIMRMKVLALKEPIVYLQ